MKRLLLMSSSRKGSMGYLEHSDEQFKKILQDKTKQVLFIPYAAVSYSYEEYEAKVKPAYARHGVDVVSIHRFADARKALDNAEALAIGGGNTFALLSRMYENKLVDAIRERVESGMPYMGWSAGSIVACPTIRTTNDMPIVAPPSLNSMSLVPFQINAHFISGKASGHNGESREERLEEYLTINSRESVVAIREGSAMYVEGPNVTLMGDLDALIFRPDKTVETIPVNGQCTLSHING